MTTDRRRFVAGVAAGMGAALGADRWFAPKACASDPTEVVTPADGEAPLVDGLTCLDYGRSLIGNQARFNAVRFWVESRTVLYHGPQAHEFLQCGSCKSENTFGEKDLFYADNYDFLPILGDGHWLVLRRMARLNPEYRQVRKVEEMWGEPVLHLRAARRVRKLESWEQIRDATEAFLPIVARTELRDESSGLRAVIECPVKTMNISHDKQMYQVDTGPIALPDLTEVPSPAVAGLQLAYVAFNAPHFADFVVEQPTPVVENGQEVCRIHHYSQPFSRPARNVLLAIEDV